MALRINGIEFEELTIDPASPTEGQVWYNTTDQQFRIRRNGITQDIIFQSTLNTHIGSTNPHTVTLEQARLADNQLAGDVDLNGNTLVNVGGVGPQYDAANQQYVKDQIDQKLQGLDWQENVLDKDLATPPGVPAIGDRYLVLGLLTDAIIAVDTGLEQFTVAGDITTLLGPGDTFEVVGSTGNDGTYTVNTAVFGGVNTVITVLEDITDATVDGNIEYTSGAWNGQYGNIVEWDGAAWIITVPDTNGGTTLQVQDEGQVYIHDGVNWAQFGSAVDHGTLVGLGDDDHLQYLNRNGVRPMTGDLNMGGQSVTNVNLVDGVDVSAHRLRHELGGADEIDGDHIGITFTPTHYTPVVTPPEASDLDHLAAHLAGIDNELNFAALDQKSGAVLQAAFVGNPKKATVSFATPFVGDYSVVLTCVTTNDKSYIVTVENQLLGSFVINAHANNIGDLTRVNWVAMLHGEST